MSATSIRTFTIQAGSDFSIALSIDTEIMTLQLAKTINDFWTGDEAVLAASDEDLIQAVARRAAPELMRAAMDGFTREGATNHLSRLEGWPEKHGITLLFFEVPDLDEALLEVQEVQPVAEALSVAQGAMP